MDLLDALRNFGEVLDIRLFEVGGTPVSLFSALAALVIALLAVWFARLAQRAVRHAFARRGVQEEGTVLLVSRLIQYSLLLVGIGIALQAAGIDLSVFFAAGAVFAVGLGFAMQNIAQNFVAGIILLAEGSIKPGDILEVDGSVVRVTQLGVRATVVRTREDEDLIVPNSLLVQSTVKNYTLQDSVFRLRAGVGVVYASDMKLVRETLETTARAMPWRLPDRDPLILMREFGDSAVVFEASVWISNPWHARRLTSELNQAIWWAFKEKGIVIAFPQLDVHFDPPVVEGIRLAAAS